MSTPLKVEKQCFEFGDRWSVAFKYDDSGFYRNGPERLKGDLVERSSITAKVVPQATRAVDVIGVHATDGLFFLEAKDFRGHRIANRHRIEGEVALEVALKVRDTVTALIGAARKGVNEFPAEDVSAHLAQGKKVSVVLWLEDDTFHDGSRAKQKLGALNEVLKTKLSWLNVQTFVLSSAVPNRLNDLTVTNLPGAGMPNP
jgi:hypothetical protein